MDEHIIKLYTNTNYSENILFRFVIKINIYDYNLKINNFQETLSK